MAATGKGWRSSAGNREMKNVQCLFRKLISNTGYAARRAFVCIAVMALLITGVVPVNALCDMGPKPEINIEINGFDEPVVYATLFAEEGEGGPSPVSFGRWKEVPEDIQQVFLDYSENDEGVFVEDVWIINKDSHFLTCGYMPPRKFKLVVYSPLKGEFSESGIYERSSLNTYFEVDLSQKDENGLLVLESVELLQMKSISDNVTLTYGEFSLLVIVRMVLTVIIELGLALLLKFRNKMSIITIVVTNILTQLYLNRRLHMYSLYHGIDWSFYFLYLFLEVEILVFEMVVYLIFVRGKRRYTVKRTIAYTLLANAVSFQAGIVVAVIGLLR